MVVHITLNIFFPHNEGLNISNNVFVLTLAWYFSEWGRFWLQHPTNRAFSFCLFEWGGEKEALPESRQTFEVTATQTSEQINLLSNRVIGVRVRAIWETDGHNRASCSKCSAITPKLFPSKMLRMLNKDLIWFMQSLSEASFSHPASRASLCLLGLGGEMEGLPKSRPTFAEVAAGQSSGLVNLVFSRQTVVFFRMRA